MKKTKDYLNEFQNEIDVKKLVKKEKRNVIITGVIIAVLIESVKIYFRDYY